MLSREVQASMRELARRLGLRYAFGVELLELTTGAPEEWSASGENSPESLETPT